MKKIDRKQLAGVEYHGKSDVTRSCLDVCTLRFHGLVKYSQIPSH